MNWSAPWGKSQLRQSVSEGAQHGAAAAVVRHNVDVWQQQALRHEALYPHRAGQGPEGRRVPVGPDRHESVDIERAEAGCGGAQRADVPRYVGAER